ncbi:hypothetical protein ACFW20_33505 [Streptomyces nigra]|uniref:hypothetical protein n=1 Tax=Streptomyces nigra TaxID=1827580 RepID=UPI0036C4D525
MRTEELLERREHTGAGTTGAARRPGRAQTTARATTPRAVLVMPLWERCRRGTC